MFMVNGMLLVITFGVIVTGVEMILEITLLNTQFNIENLLKSISSSLTTHTLTLLFFRPGLTSLMS